MSENLTTRLAPIRCFLLDMDGTFYLGDRLLDGSLAFLQRLADTGRTALFVTNNSSKSGDAYVRKLRGMGVPEAFCNVLTSGQAAARYALRAHAEQRAFLLGNPLLLDEVTRMGLAVDNDRPDYVLIGFDTTLDYAKLTRVCDLVRAGLPYIATHPDFNCPTETGFIPDIGATIAYIEASTGRKPDVILGKPYGGIVDEALRLTGLEKGQLAMAGDRLYTDIATGVNFGLLSVLVLTGEATRQDLADSPVQPDIVVERLSSLNPCL